MSWLSGLNLRKRTAGITLVVVMRHGDADAFGIARAFFAADEAGQAQAQMVFESLQLLSRVARWTDSLEAICEKLAIRLGAQATELAKLLGPFIVSDAVLQEGIAWPVALVVEHTDEAGVTRRAMYPDEKGQLHGYLKLASTDEGYLRPWSRP